MLLLAKVDIGNSVQGGLNSLFTFVPRLIGFLLILLIGYIIAKAVKKAIEALGAKTGIDAKTHQGSIGEYVDKVNPSFKPSAVIGQIAFYFIFLIVIGIAVAQLGIPGVTAFVAAITAYLPNVIAALIIFVVAGAISAAVGGLAARTMGDTPTGKIVGTVAPVLVMGIATFMILQQLKIAPEIVQITYTALLGGTTLALALAFGLGGRDVASKMLNDAYSKGQEQKGQVKQDFQKGKEQAKSDAQTAQQKAAEKDPTGNTPAPGNSGGSTGSTTPPRTF
jgi:small-conductance mechanosensitive channel